MNWQQTMRRAKARKKLRGLSFAPVAPYRVEPFSGRLIGGGDRDRWVTDFHLCDARGRTVYVWPHAPSKAGGRRGLAERRRIAEWHAEELNAP